MEEHLEDPKSPEDLSQISNFDGARLTKNEGHKPPDSTVSINAFVILLYRLLYSTVHHFS